MAKKTAGTIERVEATKNLAFLNSFVLVSFGLGLLLNHWHFSWLLIVVGLGLLFLPGYNLVKATERLAGERQEPLVHWIWTVLVSLIITPAAVWLFSVVARGNPFDYTLTSFLLWWTFSFLLAVIFNRYGRTLVALKEPKYASDIWPLIGLFIVGLLGSLVAYSFIPEADSYTYLIRLQAVQLDPHLLVGDGRPFFLVLAQTFSSLTHLAPYWLMKLGLPLLGFVLVVTTYLSARPLITQRWLRIVVSLTPLTIPVIFQELLISRPQSTFLIAFTASLYLFGRLSMDRQKSGNIYWILLLIALSLLGLKIHTLFALLVLLGLIASLIFYLPIISKRPLDALVIWLALALAIYPWVRNTRLIDDSTNLVRLFTEAFQQHRFVWWFLANYRNVDGNLAGWPGLTALYYYAYNFGLFLPVVLILAIASSSRLKSWYSLAGKERWPIWLMLVFFFIIAEIAPRFGIAFLPDRAWLFLAVGLSLLVPPLLSSLQLSPKTSKERRLPFVATVITVAAGLAIISNWGLTYIKGGWIVSADYGAVSYMTEQTASNSVFLSQGTNHVLIRYFAARQMVRPTTDIFTTADPEAVNQYLRAVAEDRKGALAANRAKRQVIKKELDQLTPSSGTQSFTDSQRTLLEQEYQNALLDQQYILSLYPMLSNPTYILYSENKTKTLYAQRAWWQTSNFFGAQTAKFSERYPVVYQQNGVTIWRVKP